MCEIIPAIDIIGGQCVRLTRGDYGAQTTYDCSPVATAQAFQEAGVRTLHLVDLDGARASRPCNLRVLRDIVAATSLQVEWGGGIKSEQSVRDALEAGAARVICGSIAVSQPDVFASWLSTYGGERIALGADVRDGLVATHGWMQSSSLSAADLIARFLPHGLTQVVCTEISRDGTLAGPCWQLYDALQAQFPSVCLTVSGGVSSMADIDGAARRNLPRIIVGKAYYEGKITLKEIQEWFSKQQCVTSDR